MIRLSRRTLLTTAASLAGLAQVGHASPALPIALTADRRIIEVNGRAAGVYALVQPDGTQGVRLLAGDRFRVALANRLDRPTLVHWHGLRPPAEQDGVPDLSQPALRPGGTYGYDFALRDSGTFWMHSHLGLQQQALLAPPLIVADPGDRSVDAQEVVVMLHDFSFRTPEEIMADLRAGTMAGIDQGAMDMSTMDHGAMDMSAGDHGAMDMAGMAAGPMSDLNDIAYDAFLANDRTLSDPQVVAVERAGRVRLRIINAAASTNFAIELGEIEGVLSAVDGRPIRPVRARRFEIAMAQRLDLHLALPGSGAFPILAVREGDRAQTGIVLATPGASLAKLPHSAELPAPALSFGQERGLAALAPLPRRAPDRRLTVALTGGMAPYTWGLDGAWGLEVRGGEAMADYPVKAGERIEITFVNRTAMSHPMHLHGHLFQVVGFADTRFAGVLRDTVLVPVKASVTIAFDADNPGVWMLHCHNLYHQAAGMMALLRYV